MTDRIPVVPHLRSTDLIQPLRETQRERALEVDRVRLHRKLERINPPRDRRVGKVDFCDGFAEIL